MTSTVRYLPADTLEVIRQAGGGARARRVHVTLLDGSRAGAIASGHALYAVVDSTLFTVDGVDGRLLRRQTLPLQAIGWPAAISAGQDGDLYVVGETPTVEAAQLYAFAASADYREHVRWHAILGFTHAGIWIGAAGGGLVAVYLPDQHDASGTVNLLDAATGVLRVSYAVPMPPTGANPGLDRLYFAGAGRIEARTVGDGRLVSDVAGESPLAVDASGAVAYVQGQRLVIAEGRELRSVVSLKFQVPCLRPPWPGEGPTSWSATRTGWSICTWAGAHEVPWPVSAGYFSRDHDGAGGGGRRRSAAEE